MNAHVLLQEFVTENLLEKTAGEQASQAILLSGKTAEALVQRAARLQSYIAGQSQGSNQLHRHSLVELAYTLQVGRDAMEERVAFVASDFRDIEEKLAAFLEGIGVSGVYRGAISHRLGRARANSRDETLDGLARAWAQGEEVDWASRLGELRPKRLSLPGYPFARDRCWIQSANNEGILPAPSSEGRRELLSQLQQSQIRVGPDQEDRVQANERISALAGKRVTVRLGPDLPFLRDHIVSGRHLVPGSAIIALIVDAARDGDSAQVVELENVVWVRPIVLNGPTDLHLDFQAHEGWLKFEVRAGDSAEVSATGRVRTGRSELDPEQVDVAEFKQRATTEISGAGFYHRLEEGGLQYGESFLAN